MRTMDLYRTIEGTLTRTGGLEVYVRAEDEVGNEVIYKVKGIINIGVDHRGQPITLLR